ncbi:MAG: serine/threonine-protein kinase, partial [Candidatus Eremiobacterota bacterium]
PTLEEVGKVVGAVAEAVAAAHRAGVVHRDLKPDNVFLTGQGAVKVVDFGVARGEEFTVATATGVMGTPAYMAPEQVEGKVDPASDQYALGVMAYEMLCGRPPFQDPDPFSLAFAQVNRHPPAPRSLRPDLSAAVEGVLLRMLDKCPGRRYPDIQAASEALRAAL